MTTLRSALPIEPLPRIVLIAVPHDDYRGRLESIDGSYDLAVVAVGPCPSGVTVQVGADGRVTEASGDGAGLWEGLQLFHLTTDDAAQVLSTIRQAHGAPPPAGEVPVT